MRKKTSKKVQELPFDIGDDVFVVHPTEQKYRWVIDGPLTVKEVISDGRRHLYKFLEFQFGKRYIGYTADRVFSTYQEAVHFRADMLRKYRYKKPDPGKEEERNLPVSPESSNIVYHIPAVSELIETNHPPVHPFFETDSPANPSRVIESPKMKF